MDSKTLLGFTSLVFNYLENGKTYRQKDTADEKYIFNFLYKFVMKYSPCDRI